MAMQFCSEKLPCVGKDSTVGATDSASILKIVTNESAYDE
jgi:hypothetical protein